MLSVTYSVCTLSWGVIHTMGMNIAVKMNAAQLCALGEKQTDFLEMGLQKGQQNRLILMKHAGSGGSVH